MRLVSLSITSVACVVLAILPAQSQDTSWSTPYERSGCVATPRLAQTIEFCRRLAAASPSVQYTTFGMSPQGRPLPLVVVSKDRIFSSADARRSTKAVVLIQGGIHAGEIDGKDAGLMLIRDMVIRHQHESLLDNAIILFVPVFNVDGHERFGAYNRINQQGPVEMGWRVTAQNLNLNRDYMKADAPEMRAMLSLFNAWLPDLLVDCHVTDGIDMQYDVTYTVEDNPNLDPEVRSWTVNRLMPQTIRTVEQAGHKIFKYVFPREERDLSKGLSADPATPRFSTGYAAIQNRPAVLIETHMLKPYNVRVSATYVMLQGILEAVNSGAKELRRAVAGADGRTIARGANGGSLPLRFGAGPEPSMCDFLAIESRIDSSTVSGGTKMVYTGVPKTRHIPFYDHTRVIDSIDVPRAYAIPPEWTDAIAILRCHGIHGITLKTTQRVDVDEIRFDSVKFQSRPYEGRHLVTYVAHSVHRTRELPAGTFVVPTAQRAGNVVVNLLEPGAPDALVGWGFFNAIFEQKEYAEAYVMEAVADTMLRNNTALEREYRGKVKSDSAFARNPWERLNWLYLQSPWADATLNVYPVVKISDGSTYRRLVQGKQP